MSTITIKSVSTETVKRGKNSYEVAEVEYLNNKGETKTKKVMSFSNPKVFDTVKNAVAGSSYEVSYAKDDPYYNWASIRAADAAPAAAAPTGGRVVGSNYETADERKLRQLYIIRQSSISNALEYWNLQKPETLKIEDVIEVAQQFVDFVYGVQEDMEEGLHRPE